MNELPIDNGGLLPQKFSTSSASLPPPAIIIIMARSRSEELLPLQGIVTA